MRRASSRCAKTISSAKSDAAAGGSAWSALKWTAASGGECSVCSPGIPRICAGSIFSQAHIFLKVIRSGNLPPSIRVRVAGLIPISWATSRMPRAPRRSLRRAPRRNNVIECDSVVIFCLTRATRSVTFTTCEHKSSHVNEQVLCRIHENKSRYSIPLWEEI
jgi:hypothetical protein